jgi:glycosyltransferase involved in cell wall biosynthesis
MGDRRLVVNGHYIGQQVTGVQRYAIEILDQFKQKGVSYRVAGPPERVQSQALKHLWMQTVLPFKLEKNDLLWSPTNLGPVMHRNQVVTLHDIADQLYPEWYSKKYVAWRKFFLPKLLNNVSGIITVSEYSKKTIQQHFPQVNGKIKVIGNGINRDHFCPRSIEEQKSVAGQYQLNKPYAISVASLDPRKNIEGVIKAWNRLPKKDRDEMDLVILGGEAEIFSFKLDMEIDSSVRFLGYVDHKNLPQLYSGARFFVYPSFFEGFGLPVLEAMACRTPVITSNSTSLSELADGKALTVDPNHPDEITDAMKKLIGSDELCKSLGETGYRHAQQFSWEKTANQTLEILDQTGS